jgi:hypothetical protein
MNLISTPFLKYHEIEAESTDIHDDAWGFNSEFSDILSYLGKIDETPADAMSERLIDLITSRS